MSSRHLEKGSTLPQVKPDLLRIYSMRFCPFAERTRLVLAHKNIPHEIVNVNLKNKPDWFLERNPLGQTPVIEYKGHYIYESPICDEFLEDAFPANGSDVPELLPSCAFKRAAARLFMTLSDQKVIPVIRMFKAETAEQRKEAQAKWNEGAKQLEAHIASTGEPFFGGAQVGMADLHIWPFFERLPAVAALYNLELLPAASFPRLTAWIAAMENTNAVKKCRVSTDAHRRYIESFLSGEPNYDLELDSGDGRN